MRALLMRLYRRSRTDRWSSLFGQVAVYSLVVTAITGVFLLFYTVTERTCLGLARRERDEAEHGRETGRIVMSPDGGYHQIREPVPAMAGSQRGQLPRLP